MKNRLGRMVAAVATVTMLAAAVPAYADTTVESVPTGNIQCGVNEVGLAGMSVGGAPVDINFETGFASTTPDGEPSCMYAGNVQTDLSAHSASDVLITTGVPGADVKVENYTSNGSTATVDISIASPDASVTNYTVGLIVPSVRISVNGEDTNVTGQTFHMNVGDSWNYREADGMRHGALSLTVDSVFARDGQLVGFDSPLIDLTVDGGVAPITGLSQWYTKLTAVAPGTVTLGYVSERDGLNGTIQIVISDNTETEDNQYVDFSTPGFESLKQDVTSGNEIEFSEPNLVSGYVHREITKQPESGEAWLDSVHYRAGAEEGTFPFEVTYTMDDGRLITVAYTPVVRTTVAGDVDNGQSNPSNGSTTTTASQSESKTSATDSDDLADTGSTIAGIAASLVAMLAVAGLGIVVKRRMA